ncbi:1-deoxy-D-xylulose-5-phosphate reductoisomerase [Candidatus Pelagibacter sp.]|nr:1-deoxy-D-xylulose-5-phosphate reductoisomerase [Candidatus Pelagibacter sp.]
MKKKIAILGSTGSIGKTLISIIDKEKKNFEIVLLTAHKNTKDLYNQAIKFKVKNLIITDKESFINFKKKQYKSNINVFNDFNSIDKILKKKVDYTMSAITGLDGLLPTLSIIKKTKNIAIANKESIICGWSLIKKELDRNNTSFVPVDSEHFSIWYALRNKNQNIEKVYLTASGGPFFKLPLSKFKNIKVIDALNHPNWKMGRKISVDSATMMNKVFELIEAKNIFQLSYDQLSILIHPKSYIHTLIKFTNGMIKIIAHETNMKIPIFNTLHSNEQKKIKTPPIDIKTLNNLTLKKIDMKKYPITKIIDYLPSRNSLFETILVSTNDEYVNLFLNGEIKFIEIQKKIIKFVKRNEFTKYKSIYPKNLKEIIDLNEYVRFKIKLISI